MFGFGKTFGPHRVGEVAKGPKNGQFKNTLFLACQNGNILVKISNTFFDSRPK